MALDILAFIWLGELFAVLPLAAAVAFNAWLNKHDPFGDR